MPGILVCIFEFVPQLLHLVDRLVRVECYRECVKRLDQDRMRLEDNFVFGPPDETLELGRNFYADFHQFGSQSRPDARNSGSNSRHLSASLSGPPKEF
jgi:hypothetical protein